MLTRRERLLATFQGRPVDRPAVSFYEIGGWRMDPNADEFTVWNDPSWRPLVQLALAKTDLLRMVGAAWRNASDNGRGELVTTERRREGDTLFVRTTIRAPGRTLTSLTSQSTDIQTVWTLEHLLKTVADVEAYLRLPEPTVGTVDVSGILAEEKALGDTGIVSIESGDPICAAASLFSMEDYTVIALTEPDLFHRLLQRFARAMFPQCEQVARACPGRLWRIFGSEYASEPYLPPRLYREYVEQYTGQMVRAIQKHGGYARIHSHGRLRGILPSIARMKPDGLDPLEPPPQGDLELAEIKAAIGGDTVLLGNLEVADIENLPPPEFERKVAAALRAGTAGPGRGFILHPSSCPYGRKITSRTLANYETMLRLAENWAG
jgi:uroporphyrinogen-III decarboxylase